MLVIFYHFSCSFDIYTISGFHNIFYTLGHTGWGSIAVYMFLMLSGASLYLNYPESFSVKNFYKKRWLSIYPQFYIAWISLYFLQSYLKDSFFWGGQYYKILLSLLGMDGYFFYLGQNYYIIGEWFLGAIIFLYILFPLLRYFFNNYEILSTIIILMAFLLILSTDYFIISDYRNIFTCTLSFWAGMVFEKYRKKIENNLFYFAFSILIFIIIINMSFNLVFYTVLLSILLFIIVFFIPRIHTMHVFSYPVILNISKYSYSLFLIHHVVIRFVMKRLDGTSLSVLEVFLWLAVVFFIIYVLAIILNIADKYLKRYCIYFYKIIIQ